MAEIAVQAGSNRAVDSCCQNVHGIRGVEDPSFLFSSSYVTSKENEKWCFSLFNQQL